jgi:hypothetical protein
MLATNSSVSIQLYQNHREKVLVCATVCCTPVNWDTREAVQQGLEVTVAQLPSSKDFEIVANGSGTSYDRECYYAQAGIAIGTSLPEEDALEQYVDELEQQGWIVTRDDLEYTRVLTRGDYERLSVTFKGPGFVMEMNEDYQRARENYPTFLFIVVDYILPGWAGC